MSQVVVSQSNNRSVLGAFTKLRKVTISFVMSVCLSVLSLRPHGTSWLPLEDFHKI
jgi:hypothetical protein